MRATLAVLATTAMLIPTLSVTAFAAPSADPTSSIPPNAPTAPALPKAPEGPTGKPTSSAKPTASGTPTSGAPTSSAPSTPAGQPDISKLAGPKLKWAPCEGKPQLQCATTLLPLDYSKPTGPKIEVFVAKKVATGKNKKGAVFINPGGPGQQSSRKVISFAETMGKPVTDQYDVIGVDPRGVYPTAQARCWSMKDKPDYNAPKFPLNEAEAKKIIINDDFERAACDKTGRPIIDHMSTANTARDMEMIRKALGEKSLNYYGVSYGTYLGATYAALFPSTVGRMITDGVVDPIAWSTGRGKNGSEAPVSARMSDSPKVTLDTLKLVFAECKKAGPKACPHGDVVEKDWENTLALLKKGPVKKDVDTITYDQTVGEVLSSLYDPESYPSMIESIHDMWERLNNKKEKSDKSLSKTAEEARKRAPGGVPDAANAKPDKVNWGAPGQEKPIEPSTPPAEGSKWTDTFGIEGVMCVDTLNSKDPMNWWRYSNTDEAKKNPFVAAWAWSSSMCANWVGHDKHAYRGPFNIKPANPLLVIGNTHDTATPLAGAKALAELSPGARLLTVDAFGHAGVNKSTCAQKALQDYLLQGKLPAEGTVCKADKPIFPTKK